MPALYEPAKLAYFPIPKNASTTLKHALYHLEHGEKFKRKKGVKRHIHHIYRAEPFRQRKLDALSEYWKFAVVRDPVKRLLSVYSNRVLHHNELAFKDDSNLKLTILRLKRRPDLETFCLNLARYQKHARSIAHHSKLQSNFLGDDLRRFDKIYRIEDMDQLAADLSERTGKEIELERFQTGGPKIPISDLSPRALKAVLAYSAPDYALLKGIYEPPSLSDLG